MKTALVNLTKSLGQFVWEVLKWVFSIINGRFVQDTVSPITFGALTMEAYKHDSWMVAPLVFLFISSMSRNVLCSEHERWRRDHPQNREELNSYIDKAIADTPLPGLRGGNLHVIVGKPKGS